MIDPKTEEQLQEMGKEVRNLFYQTQDPSMVCAVIAASLDSWCRKNGYNPIELASSIVASIQMVHSGMIKPDKLEY